MLGEVVIGIYMPRPRITTSLIRAIYGKNFYKVIHQHAANDNMKPQIEIMP